MRTDVNEIAEKAREAVKPVLGHPLEKLAQECADAASDVWLMHFTLLHFELLAALRRIEALKREVAQLAAELHVRG